MSHAILGEKGVEVIQVVEDHWHKIKMEDAFEHLTPPALSPTLPTVCQLSCRMLSPFLFYLFIVVSNSCSIVAVAYFTRNSHLLIKLAAVMRQNYLESFAVWRILKVMLFDFLFSVCFQHMAICLCSLESVLAVHAYRNSNGCGFHSRADVKQQVQADVSDHISKTPKRNQATEPVVAWSPVWQLATSWCSPISQAHSKKHVSKHFHSSLLTPSHFTTASPHWESDRKLWYDFHGCGCTAIASSVINHIQNVF